MRAPVAASVCNVSSGCRRMRPSILWASQKSCDSIVRVRTRSLEAGPNGSFVRPRPPQERNTSRLQRKTPRRAATRPGAKRAKATMSRVHTTSRDATDAQTMDGKKGNLHKTQEAATAADGASSSRSCRTTELRVGASSSFNRRSQACKIRRFWSSFK